MKYTVEINEDRRVEGLTEKEAIETAEEYASEGGMVFVTWFRRSDGQKGYLNRDGHSPNGLAW